MKTLGVETSTLMGGVACVEDSIVVAETTLDVQQTHTAVLLPAIDRVLNDAGWTVDDIDLFGVSLGPGSFTSLRIGLSTVKGLAAKRQTPLVGIETLRAMAAGIIPTETPIMPLIDARQGEFYTAMYVWESDQLSCKRPAAVGPLENLFADIREALWCPGNVEGEVEAHIAAITGNTVRVPQPRLPGPRAAVVAELATTDFLDITIAKPVGLQPIYLRDHLGKKPVA